MTWDPVPFFVGGGAEHSAEVVRLAVFRSPNGNQGIYGPDDLRVSAQSVAAASVQVGVGACAILNRSSSGAYQTYIGRNPTVDTPVGVAATGSGAGRADMVVVRVEDPNNVGEGWAAPTDRRVGPYIFSRVLSGVGAAAIASPLAAAAYLATTGYSAIPLGGVNMPAGQTAVQQSYITDLRTLANPRSDNKPYTINPTGVAAITAPSGAWTNWIGSWQVTVPPWAVRAVVTANIGGARLDRVNSTTPGTANGQIRVAIGAMATQGAAYDLETTASNIVARSSLAAGDTVAVPAANRGTVQTMTIQGYKAGGSMSLYADTATFAWVNVEFQESAA